MDRQERPPTRTARSNGVYSQRLQFVAGSLICHTNSISLAFINLVQRISSLSYELPPNRKYHYISFISIVYRTLTNSPTRLRVSWTITITFSRGLFSLHYPVPPTLIRFAIIQSASFEIFNIFIPRLPARSANLHFHYFVSFGRNKLVFQLQAARINIAAGIKERRDKEEIPSERRDIMGVLSTRNSEAFPSWTATGTR